MGDTWSAAFYFIVQIKLSFTIGKMISDHFKKIVVRCKKIGYNIDVLRQTACLVVNPIKVNNFSFLFYCTAVGRASD